MNRRRLLRDLGISTAALPFLSGLPAFAAPAAPRQRLLFVFTPNGTVQPNFWPNEEETGPDFALKPILEPLQPFKDRLLLLKGISNKVRGDGDSHQRGMSCLLTGIELFSGNIMGGGGQPAGWAKGISIDQEIKNHLQSQSDTRTRLGSLELGVCVSNRADPWTRWSYEGANKPVAPVSDPYQVLAKLYGQTKDRVHLMSILDGVHADLKRVSSRLGAEDKALLEQHADLVRSMEKDLASTRQQQDLAHPAPELEDNVSLDSDQMPRLSRMQTDLMVSALANDFCRVGSIMFTNSVGNAKMRWLGIEEGHHSLSHDPDLNDQSQEKLTRINTWLCAEIAHLATRLDSIAEPGGSGSMLDHTLIVWTNELGKGNSHTLDNIPFVLIGKAPGLRTGRFEKFDNVPHNRLHLTLAQSMGHELQTFGNPTFCEAGPLAL